MTDANKEAVAHLDYSKPPPGYLVHDLNDDGWWWRIEEPEDGCTAPFDTEAEALAAAWVHYKARNDPPGLWVEEVESEVPEEDGWGFSTGNETWYADWDEHEARAAAWTWHNRRHALHRRVSDDPRYRIDFCNSCDAENEPQEEDECPVCEAEGCLISTWGESQAERYRTGERYTTDEGQADIDGASPIWPCCLTWTDEQVAEVERWLRDSTAEMPEVLRG